MKNIVDNKEEEEEEEEEEISYDEEEKKFFLLNGISIFLGYLMPKLSLQKNSDTT